MKNGRKVSKAEFVAVLALLGNLNREAYREIRKQAWDSVQFDRCSTLSN
jgi:hypothetical protein